MPELTPSQRTWKTFKRNKSAMAGLVFIIITALVAILGYLIMPDSTPDANNMAIQLSLKKPGSKFTFLNIRKPEPVDTVGIFTKIISGQASFYPPIQAPTLEYQKFKRPRLNQ